MGRSGTSTPCGSGTSIPITKLQVGRGACFAFTVSGEASGSRGLLRLVSIRKKKSHYFGKIVKIMLTKKIQVELKKLSDTNRVLIDLNSQAAWEQILENWKKMRILEKKLEAVT